MVQCHCVNVQERWKSAVLHQPLQIKYENQERLLSASPDTWSHQEFSWHRILLLGFECHFWQIAMDQALKQYTAFTVGNLGLFECKHMAFGLCNASALFQRLMQSCLGKLNMTFCLIYLDDVIVFSKTGKSTYITCTLCLSASDRPIWSLSQQSTSSLRVRLTIWRIMSPRKAYDPVKRTQ